MVSVALGLQRKMLWTPVLEGIATITLSVWLGHKDGAVGVAVGVLLGGLLGVGLVGAQNVIRIIPPDFKILNYLFGNSSPDVGLFVCH